MLMIVNHPLVITLHNCTAAPHIYTLSLHDALPISAVKFSTAAAIRPSRSTSCSRMEARGEPPCPRVLRPGRTRLTSTRSEEHTSELQSRVDLVCRLLLEKKK